MDRMRILQVAHGFPPDEQAGAELCAYYLSHELSRRGHRVEVLARTTREAQDVYSVVSEDLEGVRVHRLRTNTEKAASLAAMYRDERVAELFRRQLERGYDVVHIHHLFGLSTDFVAVAKAAGARVVVTLHDFWYLCPRGQRLTPRGHLCTEIQPWRCSLCIAKKRARWAWNSLLQHAGEGLRSPLSSSGRLIGYVGENLWLKPIHDRSEFIVEQLNQADACLSPSQFLLDEYRRHGLTVARSMVSHNGQNIEWAESFPDRERHTPLRFGFIGSFLPSKGVDLLLDAFQQMPKEEATLEFYGTSRWDGGRFFRSLKARNRHAGATFHGEFPHEQLPDILQAVDVLVVPSRWFENAPLTLDEAAAASLPVIASNHGGLRECVERRQNGLLFQADNAGDLRRTMLRFAREPDLWEQLRHAKEPVKTAEQHAAELEDLYQSLG